MSTQLQIDKSNAVQAYANTDIAGKILLQSLFGKEIFEKRVSSFDEALKKSGKTNFLSIGIPDDEIAFAKLKIIIKQLNGDWEPDWSDDEQPKYMIWWNMEPFSLFCVGDCCEFSAVPSRLCFRDRETANYFLSIPEFVELYKTYMPTNGN